MLDKWQFFIITIPCLLKIFNLILNLEEHKTAWSRNELIQHEQLAPMQYFFAVSTNAIFLWNIHELRNYRWPWQWQHIVEQHWRKGSYLWSMYRIWLNFPLDKEMSITARSPPVTSTNLVLFYSVTSHIQQV